MSRTLTELKGSAYKLTDSLVMFSDLRVSEGGHLLLESGDRLLLESGDAILLEGTAESGGGGPAPGTLVWDGSDIPANWTLVDGTQTAGQSDPDAGTAAVLFNDNWSSLSTTAFVDVGAAGNFEFRCFVKADVSGAVNFTDDNLALWLELSTPLTTSWVELVVPFTVPPGPTELLPLFFGLDTAADFYLYKPQIYTA